MTETKRVTGSQQYHYPECSKLDQTNKPIKTYPEEYAKKHWSLCDMCSGEWRPKNDEAAANAVHCSDGGEAQP